MEISYDFSGKSFPLTQENIDAMDCPAHHKLGEEISLGFSGHDIEKLMDIPLVINAQVQLHEQEKHGYQSGYEMRIVQSQNHRKSFFQHRDSHT